MRAAIAIGVGLVLATGAVARAAPPFPLEDLLARAETVFIGRRVAGEFLVFQPARFHRGAAASLPKSFRLAPWSQPIPPGDYFVFSQGDPHFGPPTDEIELDQWVECQRSYRGWIALPLARFKGRDLDALVKRAPYDPTKL